MKSLRSVRTLCFAALLASAAGAALVACSSDPADSAAPSTGDIQADTGVEWVVDYDAITNTAELAFPKTPTAQVLAAGADPAQAAAAFLVKYPTVFGVQSASDLTLDSSETDAVGATHVIFIQKVAELDVEDAVLAVHFDAAGGVDHVTGPFYPNLGALVAAPRVGKDAAAQAAQTALAGDANGQTVTVVETSLGLHVDEGVAKYVYAVRLKVGHASWEVWIDPQTGASIREIPLRHTVVQASGQGIRQKRSFEIEDANNGVYPLKRAKNGNVPALAVYNYTSEALITSKNQNEWETNVPQNSKGLAVEAIYKFHEILGWWKTANGWSSFDNKGSAVDLVIYGDEGGPTNAAWAGDHVEINVGTDTVPPSADIDTLGHEFTHAVVDYTAKLRGSRNCNGESDAMNEGIADVFGETVAHFTEGGDPAVLSDEFGTGAIIRSLADPGLHRGKPGANIGKGADHMGVRQGECHYDAGVVDLAWYLMTFGGSHPDPKRNFTLKSAPLGIETARKLWWQTLKSEIRGVRAISLLARRQVLAARNLGLAVDTPACAWQAVGALSADELKSRFNVDCNATTDAGPVDADANAVDSCQGRADGMYCSAINPSASFACTGQIRSGGDSCLTTQKCTGPNGPGTTIQCQ